LELNLCLGVGRYGVGQGESVLLKKLSYYIGNLSGPNNGNRVPTPEHEKAQDGHIQIRLSKAEIAG
jgi:hypothetical protein